MLLENKTAILFGAAGAVGGTFAREGSRLFLSGRTESTLQAVADDIAADGGEAEIAVVDALDRTAVERHAASVVEKAGAIDISLNAVDPRGDLQGTPLLEISEHDFITLRGGRGHGQPPDRGSRPDGTWPSAGPA